MKISFKISLVITLLLIVCLNTTCKKTVEISYDGYVYDSLSSKNPKGVSRVVVLLSACNGKQSGYNSQCMGSLYTIEQATTDADGHFSIHSTTKLKNQSFYVGIENSPYSAANIGYSLSNLPTKLYMHN
ncbi:MAG TPA: hypothetical protein PKZ75_08065 [Bacteroidia bacterium]|nr:hypothetical protein [Bacteroidia bacterium]